MNAKDDRIEALEAALRLAREFVDRHSEIWYNPGQQLLRTIDQALGSVPKCAQNGAGEGNRTPDQQLGKG